MQDKIIAAIAAYLETRIYFGYRIDRKDAEKLAEDIYSAAIAPLVEPGEVDWEDAPEWAQWRTVDKDRGVTFWSSRPEPKNGYWRMGKDGGQFEFSRYDVNWGNKIQQRPK